MLRIELIHLSLPLKVTLLAFRTVFRMMAQYVQRSTHCYVLLDGEGNHVRLRVRALGSVDKDHIQVVAGMPTSGDRGNSTSGYVGEEEKRRGERLLSDVTMTKDFDRDQKINSFLQATQLRAGISPHLSRHNFIATMARYAYAPLSVVSTL